MLTPIGDNYFQYDIQINICLQFLREYILKKNIRLTEAWKYGMPFFYYNGKRCCYLWVDKKLKQPYIGFIEGTRLTHSELRQEKRSQIKILLIDPNEDLPLEVIDEVLDEMIALYQQN